MAEPKEQVADPSDSEDEEPAIIAPRRPPRRRSEPLPYYTPLNLPEVRSRALSAPVPLKRDMTVEQPFAAVDQGGNTPSPFYLAFESPYPSSPSLASLPRSELEQASPNNSSPSLASHPRSELESASPNNPSIASLRRAPGIQKSIFPILIAVLGLTRSKKTAFIEEACGLLPQSVQTFARPLNVDGRDVTLLDLPELENINPGTGVLDLSRTEYHGRTLQGIIYVHRMAELRVGRISPLLDDLWHGQPLTGKNVVIVVHMPHEVRNKNVQDTRKRLLGAAGSDMCFKQVLRRGASLRYHDGTTESAHSILRHIINNL